MCVNCGEDQEKKNNIIICSIVQCTSRHTIQIQHSRHELSVACLHSILALCWIICSSSSFCFSTTYVVRVTVRFRRSTRATNVWRKFNEISMLVIYLHSFSRIEWRQNDITGRNIWNMFQTQFVFCHLNLRWKYANWMLSFKFNITCTWWVWAHEQFHSRNTQMRAARSTEN